MCIGGGDTADAEHDIDRQIGQIDREAHVRECSGYHMFEEKNKDRNKEV